MPRPRAGTDSQAPPLTPSLLPARAPRVYLTAPPVAALRDVLVITVCSFPSLDASFCSEGSERV